METNTGNNNSRISRVESLEPLGFFRNSSDILKESERDYNINPKEHDRLKRFIIKKINQLFPLKEKSSGFNTLAVILIGLSKKT